MPSIVVTPPPTAQSGKVTVPGGGAGNVQIVDLPDPDSMVDTEDPVMGNLVLLLAGTAVVLCCCFCCLVLCVIRKQKQIKTRWARTRRKMSAQAVMSQIVGQQKGKRASPVFHSRPHRHGGTAGGDSSDSESDSEESSDTERDLEVSMEIGMLDHNGRKRPSVRPHAVEHGHSIYFDHHSEIRGSIALPITTGGGPAEPSDDEVDQEDPTDSGERLSDELWREDQEGDMAIAPVHDRSFVNRQFTGEDDVVIGSPTVGDDCPDVDNDDAPRLLLPPTRGNRKEESDDDEEVPPPPLPPTKGQFGNDEDESAVPVAHQDPPPPPPMFSQSRYRRQEGSR